MCFLVTCWERADLLALVCGVFCEFVTFPLVSRVRCGTWLYRFLIFAPLLTFMQTKYLCVMIHIWIKGEVGGLNRFKPSSKIFYGPFQGGTSCVDLLCFFCLVFAMSLCASVYMCFVVTCWERSDLLALVCGVLLWVCHFPIGILGQVWDLIVSFPDLCTLTYFKLVSQHQPQP